MDRAITQQTITNLIIIPQKNTQTAIICSPTNTETTINPIPTPTTTIIEISDYLGEEEIVNESLFEQKKEGKKSGNSVLLYL